MTFSLAGEKLTEKESRESFMFFISLFTAVATGYIIYKLIKQNKKFSAIGIAIPFLFALYVSLSTGLVYLDNLNYRQKFDRTKWVESEYKPFKMAKTIVKDKTLVGLTKRQVIEKLGATNNALKNDKVDYLKYSTDKSTWELCLYFKGDKVIDVYLYEEGLEL